MLPKSINQPSDTVKEAALKEYNRRYKDIEMNEIPPTSEEMKVEEIKKPEVIIEAEKEEKEENNNTQEESAAQTPEIETTPQSNNRFRLNKNLFL